MENKILVSHIRPGMRLDGAIRFEGVAPQRPHIVVERNAPMTITNLTLDVGVTLIVPLCAIRVMDFVTRQDGNPISIFVTKSGDMAAETITAQLVWKGHEGYHSLASCGIYTHGGTTSSEEYDANGIYIRMTITPTDMRTGEEGNIAFMRLR